MTSLGDVAVDIRANMSRFRDDFKSGLKDAQKTWDSTIGALKWPAALTGGAAASSMGLVTAGAGAATAAVLGLGAAGGAAALALVGVGAAGSLMSKQVRNDFAQVGVDIKKDFTSIGSAFVTPMEKVAGALDRTIGQLTKQFKPAISALAPVFMQFASLALGELTALAKAFSPLINAAGPILQGVLKGLQPLFAGINQTVSILAPVMAQLAGKVFPMLAETVGPLLPVLATLLSSLATAGQAVLPSLLSVVTQIVVGLAPFLSQLGQMAAQLFPSLLAALDPIIPFVLQLADSLMSIAQQVLPVLIPILGQLLTQLGGQLQALMPDLVKGIVSLADAFLQIFPALMPLIPVIGQLLGQILPLIPPVTTLAANLINFLAPGISLVASVIANVGGPIISGLGSMIGGVVSWANDLIGIFDKVVNAADKMIQFLSLGMVGADVKAKANPNIFSQAAGDPTGTTNYLGQPISSNSPIALPQMPTFDQIAMPSLGRAMKAAAQPKAGGAASGAAKAAINTLVADLKTAATKVSNDTSDQIKANWDKVAKDLTTGGHAALAKAVLGTEKSLMGLANALNNPVNGVNVQLKTAQDNLKKLTDANKQLADSVRATVIGLGDVTSAQGWTTLDTVTDQLKLAIKTSGDFDAAIKKLTAEHLNSDTLNQLITAGPTAGMATAQALLAGGQSGVDQVNTLASQLHASADDLAKTTSDAMYAAGIQAAQGLVAGLQSQHDALTKMMQGLADTMVTELKKALKIKSPSGLMAEEVGRPSGAGIIQGLMQTDFAGAAGDAASQLAGGARGYGGGGQLHATIDLGEGIQVRTKIAMDSRNRAMKSRVLAGSSVGNYTGR